MERAPINERLLRFVQCNNRFLPYLERVLMRLPKEGFFKEVLDDLSFQIISVEYSYWGGVCAKFSDPIQYLIILNEMILNRSEPEIIYTIAHEIAHKVLAKKRVSLPEKEVEDLLIKWGFEEECKSFKSSQAKYERMGYEIGFKWANCQAAIDLIVFEDFYDKWNEVGLTEEWLEQFYSIANPKDIFDKVDFFSPNSQKVIKINYDDYEENIKAYIKAGIFTGVMEALRLKKQTCKE